MKKLLVTAGISIIAVMAIVLAAVAACAPKVTPTTTAATTAPTTQTATAPEQKVFNWRWADFSGRGTVYFEYTQKAIDICNAAAGGRLKLEHLGAGEVFEGAEVMDAVSKGLVEAGWTVGAYNTGKSLGLGYTSGPPPHSLPSRGHMEVWLYRYGAMDVLQDWYHKNLNIHILGIVYNPGATLMSKFPVTKVDDIKGKTLRAYGPVAEMLGGAGAAVSWFPMEETYSALEKGVLDGAVVGGPGAEHRYSLEEVTKYLLLTPMTPIDTGDVGVNLDKWNELPPDLQEILKLTMATKHADIATEGLLWDDAQALKAFRQAGIKFTTLSEEEIAKLRAASMAVAENYSKQDALYAKLTELLKNYMKDLGLL